MPLTISSPKYLIALCIGDKQVSQTDPNANGRRSNNPVSSGTSSVLPCLMRSHTYILGHIVIGYA